MRRVRKTAGRVIGMAAVALAILTAGNLVAQDTRARGETAVSPEAVARIVPALRGPLD